MWVCNHSQTTALEHDWLWQIHFGFTRWAAAQLIILVTYLNPSTLCSEKAGYWLQDREVQLTTREDLSQQAKEHVFFNFGPATPLKPSLSCPLSAFACLFPKEITIQLLHALW